MDIVGGTSIGSQMGSMVARKIGIQQMISTMHNAYVKDFYLSFLRDVINIPYLALAKGQQFKRMLKLIVGDIEIEDFWLPYFAVSTNLTTSASFVHRSGSAFIATRSSSSLAILLPPVQTDDGLLADGII